MVPKLFRNNIASFGTPTLGDLTNTSMSVAGSIEWYKDGEVGVAYKKNSASTWTYVPQDGNEIETSLTSLTKNTKYDVCFYVYFGGEYQRGPIANATTTNET